MSYTAEELAVWAKKICAEADARWEAYRAKYGEKAYREKRYGNNPEWERMDAKINKSTQEFLEDVWDNQGISQIEIPEDRHRRVRQGRPYIGCPDCPRWNGRRCTKQFENTTLCREIEERYLEKAE